MLANQWILSLVTCWFDRRMLCIVAGLVLMCTGRPAFTQQSNWEAIPAAELSLKEEPKAPGAPAIILYRTVAGDDNRGDLNAFFRIKVLTEPGTRYADVEIATARWMKVESLEARTVRPDGSTVPFTGTVHDTTVAKYRKYEVSIKTFTLPDVRPGTIIEYRYRMHWKPEENYSLTWDVQSELFTRRAHFELKGKPGKSLHWVAQNLQQQPTAVNGNFFVLDVSNVAPLEEEDQTLPKSELLSKVTFFYGYPGYETPESFWGRYSQYVAEGLDEFIGHDNRVKSVVASAVSPSNPPEARLRVLYTRAQQVRKISAYDVDSEEGRKEKLKENKHANDVLERNYGTIYDISALLVAMAREVGYRSGLVFLADRRRGLFHPDVLSWSQLTATLLWVEKDGRFQLLDPACEKCPFGLISWDQGGASGIRTNYGGASVYVKAPVNTPEEDTIERAGKLTLAGDGTLSGEINVSFGGLQALEFRNNSEKSDETARKKAVTDRVKAWLPESADVTLRQLLNWDQIDKPIVVDMAVSLPGFASVTSKRLLMPAWPFGTRETDPFPHQRRTYAVVFDNPYQRKDDLTINVPTGYQLETIPPEKRINDGILDYSLQVDGKGDSIHVARVLTNHALYVQPQFYKQLRNDFQAVKANDEQPAILRQTITASR